MVFSLDMMRVTVLVSLAGVVFGSLMIQRSLQGGV